MSKQKKKEKHQLEKVALIVSIINMATTSICLIYTTFFKSGLGGGENLHCLHYKTFPKESL